MDIVTPIVARIEAFGTQVVNQWTYTQRPRTSRYIGGTSNGGFYVLPPEMGMEYASSRFSPSDGITLSTTYFATAPGAYFGSGIVDGALGLTTGFRWGANSSGLMTFSSLSNAAVATDVLSMSTSAVYPRGSATLGQGTNIWSEGYIRSLFLGEQSVFSGTLRFFEAGSAFSTTLRSTGMTADATYDLPPQDGANGTVLTTDGAGSLSWAAASGGAAASVYANERFS